MRIKEIKEFYLNHIEKLGYKITVKPMSQTSYAWANDGEENSSKFHMVTNFYINKCKGWIFGLWITPKADKDFFTDDDIYAYEVNFFAEYEKNADKFKPSATFLCETITIKDCEDLKNNYTENMFTYYYYVEELIRMIHKQPYIAYYMANTFLKYPDYNGSYLFYFLWDRFLANTWEIRMPLVNLMWKLKNKKKNKQKNK